MLVPCDVTVLTKSTPYKSQTKWQFFPATGQRDQENRQEVTPNSWGVILRCSYFFWVDLSNLSLPPYVSSPLCWKSSEIPFFPKLNHSKAPSFSSHGLGTPRTLGPSAKVKLSRCRHRHQVESCKNLLEEGPLKEVEKLQLIFWNNVFVWSTPHPVTVTNEGL